jgi:hypothetical protein
MFVFVLAAFCWTKSLSCIVADFTGMLYQFKVFKYLEFISLIWKRPQCHKRQEGIFGPEDDSAKSTAY